MWVEISLTTEEENEVEVQSKSKHIDLMKECLTDAEKLLADENKKEYQSDAVRIAISLFEKRASHIVFEKDRKCKEKFDQEK